tara:strand:+ start:21574 stop:22581 length:1008 start_codon:yes stop_codon:yes gene_type:complete
LINELTKLIDTDIRNQFQLYEKELYFPIQYALGIKNLDNSETKNRPGKSIRPLICILIYTAASIDPTKFIETSLSLEYIHNYSLIHDDIQDNDEFRHNKPTIWKIWGKDKALIIGNMLNNIAYIQMTNGEKILSKKQITDISQVLNQATLEMIEGQYLDIHFETKKTISEKEYLNMISKKTGALLQASVIIGSIIGNYNYKDVSILKKFSESLGYLFQITDDVLGIWGDSSKTGKPVGSDIINKKKSLPIIHCKNTLNAKDLILFNKIYSADKIKHSDVQIILNLLDKTSTQKYTQSLAMTYYKSCIELLNSTSLNHKKTIHLKLLLEKLVSREK